MLARLSGGWTGMIRAKLATWRSFRCARPRSPPGACVSRPVKLWQPAQEAEKILLPAASCRDCGSFAFCGGEVPQAERVRAITPSTNTAIVRWERIGSSLRPGHRMRAPSRQSALTASAIREGPLPRAGRDASKFPSCANNDRPLANAAAHLSRRGRSLKHRRRPLLGIIKIPAQAVGNSFGRRERRRTSQSPPSHPRGAGERSPSAQPGSRRPLFEL